MNRTVDKWTVDATKYIKEDVLDIMPDIPRDELSHMVSKHIYYGKRMSPRTKRMM